MAAELHHISRLHPIMQHTILCSLAVLSIAAFFYDVQAAPTAIALRDSAIDTTGDSSNTRVKRQGGGCCGCCGGCGGCGGCGCCCCKPCCCCQRCCTCCRTCCCTRCCTCCRPCCCGCGCGCCGCGGGRKRRSLQKLAVKLAEKKSLEAVSAEVVSSTVPALPTASHEQTTPEEAVPQKRETVQTPVGAIVDVPEWPNSYGYY